MTTGCIEGAVHNLGDNAGLWRGRGSSEQIQGSEEAPRAPHSCRAVHHDGTAKCDLLVDGTTSRFQLPHGGGTEVLDGGALSPQMELEPDLLGGLDKKRHPRIALLQE